MLITIIGWWCGLSLACALGWYVGRNAQPRCADHEAICMACGMRGYDRVWCNAEDCKGEAS
jgi:hypothetical protein